MAFEVPLQLQHYIEANFITTENSKERKYIHLCRELAHLPPRPLPLRHQSSHLYRTPVLHDQDLVAAAQ